MGISNDYGIAPSPNTGDPDPQTGNDGFLAYKEAGVDSFQFHIRGGTHEESAFIPGVTVPALGLATLRGTDLVSWYSTAWFDRYVKCGGDSGCEQEADKRLLTDRWRNDKRSEQIDTNGDGNVYSFYRRSRYDFHTSKGAEVSCDDMRAGCASMGPDGLPPGYDVVADAFTPDSSSGGGGGGAACSLGQRGTRFADSPETLPPSDAGDSIHGGKGDDRLRGGAGSDCLFGGGGNDRLAGQGQADKLKGGAGADRARGGGGRDKLNGGAGGDRLSGGKGRDKLNGRAGRDVLIGGPGNDVILAKGGGRDRIICGPGHDRVHADRQDRVSRSCR